MERGRQLKSTNQTFQLLSKPSSSYIYLLYIMLKIFNHAPQASPSKLRALRQAGVSLFDYTVRFNSCHSLVRFLLKAIYCERLNKIPVNLSSISFIYCCLYKSSYYRSSKMRLSLVFCLQIFSTLSSMRSMRKGLCVVCVALQLGCDGFFVTNCDILDLQWLQLDMISFISSKELLWLRFFFWSVSYQLYSIKSRLTGRPLLFSLLFSQGTMIFFFSPFQLVFENMKVIITTFKNQPSITLSQQEMAHIESMNKKTKIAHDYDQLEDQIILTLKDRPILVNGSLDEDEDVLQNEEVQEANQARYNAELKSKLKNIADASSSHLEAKNEGISDILPHYNDYTYKPATIEMDEGGTIKFKKTKKKKALGQDYAQSDTVTNKLNSEYATKNKKTDEKKSSKQLLSFLEETAEDNVPTLKRQFQADDIINASLDVLRKKRIADNEIRSIAKQQVIDQQESLLIKSIQQSRRRAERQRQQKFDLLAAIKEQDEQHPNQGKKVVEIELNPIAYRSSQAVRQTKTVQVKEALSGTASVMHMRLPSQRLSKHKQDLPESFKELTSKQLQKMRDQVKFLEDKQLGTGLSGALQYLRENALLGKQQQVGRYNDKSMDYNYPNDRIKLQYRNASGKLMKPKQAYRYICAKFHGEGSSKNKVQMRKRRELQQIRAKQQQNKGGQLLQLLQKHQTKSGDAHMVLNIGGKAAK